LFVLVQPGILPGQALPQVEQAKELLNARRYNEALPLLRKSATSGNAEAEMYLALMYENGWGLTRLRVAGRWTYLYRAIDSAGNTIDFLLSPNRDLTAAKGFLQLALSAVPVRPRVIYVDGHPAYATAITELKESGELNSNFRCRPSLPEQHYRAGSSFREKADHGKSGLSLRRRSTEHDRGIRSHEYHPKRSDPLVAQRRCSWPETVHRKIIRNRRLTFRNCRFTGFATRHGTNATQPFFLLFGPTMAEFAARFRLTS
jgi:transposase-like protein